MDADLKQFNEWRKKSAAHLPTLARRIFALRKKMYEGAGFHWSLEKRLGGVMRELNDYDTPTYHTDVAARVVLEVAVDGLYADVKKAEDSAKKFRK